MVMCTSTIMILSVARGLERIMKYAVLTITV